jgi:hypothetical protein
MATPQIFKLRRSDIVPLNLNRICHSARRAEMKCRRDGVWDSGGVGIYKYVAPLELAEKTGRGQLVPAPLKMRRTPPLLTVAALLAVPLRASGTTGN